MVGMQITFGNCDQQTPHGGPPFHYWKKGYGFGHSKGPGMGNVLHPAAPVQLRFTPNGDRAMASNPFWRGKYELGPAYSFGIGDRPDYGRQNKAVNIGPDNYGDVSKVLDKTKESVVRPNIKLKPRFPSMEEKYRDLSWPQCGPGPARYDTRLPPGQSSWSYPAKNSSFTFGVKPLLQGDLRESIGKPGPTEYNVRVKPGRNSPIQHGTLFDISMRGRVKIPKPGEASPGPARYAIRGKMDEYGLWDKIANVKGPPAEYWRNMVPSPREGSRPLDEGAGGASGSGAQAEAPRTLTRVESSPL